MELTKNRTVLDWIDAQVQLTKPSQVVWIDGSEAQLEALRQEACASGELYKLNEEKLPGCYLHRSDPTDVARVESRTFICCERQEDAGRRAGEALCRGREALEAGLTPDAVLTDAEEALDALGELTGRTAKEEIVERIFSRFCVGK